MIVALLVGGPRDGERIALPDNRDLIVAKAPSLSVGDFLNTPVPDPDEPMHFIEGRYRATRAVVFEWMGWER